MTPILCCGAECGLPGVHFSTLSADGTISTTTVRNGARSFRILGTGSNVNWTSIALASANIWVVRFAIRFASLPTADVLLADLNSSAFGLLGFKASDGKIYPRMGATFGSQGYAVTTNTWYVISARINASADPFLLDVTVDGTALTQLSLTGSPGTRTQLRFILAANTGGDMFIDDITISQTSADHPIGDGFVNHFVPTSDVSHNVAGAADFRRTLTSTDILNSTTDAYLLVDGVPLIATDISAVECISMIAPPNATDYVQCQFGPAPGINVPTTGPRAVEVIGTLQTASGGGSPTMDLSLRLNDNGTIDDIYVDSLFYRPDTPSFKRKNYATAPSTGVAWTAALFNALKVRFGSYDAADSAPDGYFGAIMIEAEFAPAGLQTTQTILGKARVTAQTTKTLAGRSAVKVTVDRTLAGRARVTVQVLQMLDGRTRVTAQTTKTLQGRADILNAITQTVLGKSAILKTASQTILGLAALVKTVSQTILGKGNISATTTKTQLGKAAVLKTVSQALTGIARLVMTATKTLQGISRITASASQTLQGQARITQTASKTLQGKTRIQKTVSQLMLGLARMTASTSRTLQGLTRITAIISQTLLGRARVTAQTSKTILGKADLLKAIERDLLGKAKISVTGTTDQDILGKAALKKTTDRTLLGKGAISVMVLKTLLGLTRITASATKTILGKAVLKRTVDQLQSGNARITNVTERLIMAVSNILATASRNQLGRANIFNAATVDKIIGGRAMIIIPMASLPLGDGGTVKLVSERTIKAEVLLRSVVAPSERIVKALKGESWLTE